MKEVNRERRKVRMACVTVACVPIVNCQDFSSWKRLLRVTSYVMRFCHNMHKSVQSKDLHIGPLTAEEIKNAEEYWLKQGQSALKERMKGGDFKALSPFVDQRGIIRVGGRVSPAIISYDNQQPALLPHNHWISVLVTQEAHKSGHAGVATTTAKVRRRYWILKGHTISKKIKHQCTLCRKFAAKTETQRMADLPQCRLQPYSPPFMSTSCDYFGPVKVKIARNKTDKHYGVIFTCLNSRAVHCELATDASTMQLLQVLRRFFSYRGYPKLLL